MISEDDETERSSPRQVTSNPHGMEMQERNRASNASATSGQNRRGMVLPFQPLSLTFNHINYYVDMPAVSVYIFAMHLSTFH